ncbi:DUF4350 domain-containing protein [Evansella cellulosilytica]|nr:DUF4350 domain-containing protein [Evansella cellulosilytica]
MKNVRRMIVWISILAIFLVVSYFGFSNQPREYPAYISSSPSPTGVKALYTYMENEYDDVTRWYNSPDVLQSEQSLLLMIEPFFVPMEEEMNEYVRFMEEGNTILLFSENPVGMFDIKVEYGYLTEPLEEEYHSVQMNEQSYQSMFLSNIRIQTEENDEVLITDDLGAIAIRRPIGEGHLMIVNTPHWTMNTYLLDYDHIPLVLQMIEEGYEDHEAIIFDEYIHHQGNAATFITVYPKWFILFMIQGALLAILLLLYQGKRFGPIYQVRDEAVRFSDEGTRALAAWYLRGSRYADALAMQADYLKLLLQEKWMISYNREWKDISEELDRKWARKSHQEIKAFLEGLHIVLGKQKVSKQEFLLWSKRLEELRKGVEEG